MGFLDNLAGAVLGAQGGQSALTRSVLDMLGGQGGGLGGLAQAFQQGGLGHLMDSWIGTGQNLPVSPAQLQQVLGPKIGALAQQHGMSQDAVGQALSQLLPGLVDQLTPNGQISQGTLEQGLSALRSKLGV
jgi:uncharacterized protein YidB (DUF937 family)